MGTATIFKLVELAFGVELAGLTVALFESNVLDLSLEVALTGVETIGPLHDSPRLHVVATPVGFVDAVGISSLLSRRKRDGPAEAPCSSLRKSSKVLRACELKQRILNMMSRCALIFSKKRLMRRWAW